MSTRLTKKQQSELTEKLTGVIQKNNAPQLRLSMDTSVNEMNVNQISGALNRIHGQAIGKDLPTVVTIPVKQSGIGVPSPDNIRPIVGYEIDGIGTVYGGELNIDTGVLTVNYILSTLSQAQWGLWNGDTTRHTISTSAFSNTDNTEQRIFCPIYQAVVNNSSNWFDITGYDYAIYKPLNNAFILLRDIRWTTLTQFQTALRGVPFAYKVTNPQTYTLTPQQMLQLLDQL